MLFVLIIAFFGIFDVFGFCLRTLAVILASDFSFNVKDKKIKIKIK